MVFSIEFTIMRNDFGLWFIIWLFKGMSGSFVVATPLSSATCFDRLDLCLVIKFETNNFVALFASRTLLQHCFVLESLFLKFQAFDFTYCLQFVVYMIIKICYLLLEHFCNIALHYQIRHFHTSSSPATKGKDYFL